MQQRTLAGRYQLQEPLGQGAIGQVWRAWDERRRRTVAVKLIQVGQIRDPDHVAETIARFQREVEAVAKLRHASIVTAFEAGRAGDELFLVMELADGISLADVIEQRSALGLGLLPVPDVLAMAEQVCAGLAAAHAAAVVHRDIKPSNLMVCGRQQMKIIDFGMARLLDDGSPRLTRQGQAVGTLAYMSPEQLDGSDLDGRADLYSLGCVLYELLAGQRPFIAELPEALMMKHLYEQPSPLRFYRPELPAELTTLIDDLLAKDRAARPADAGAVIDRLAAIRAQAEDREPRPASAYEADPNPESSRLTVYEADPNPESTRLTVYEADPNPESSRATMLADEAAAGAVRQPTEVAGAVRQPTEAAGAVRQPTEAAATQAGHAPHQGPVRFGPGLSAVPAPPAMPDWAKPARPKRPSRQWPRVLSTFLTLAIIAGVGVVLWIREHDVLKVTTVAVAPAAPPRHRCNITVDVVGTILTNGRGGQVRYQWIRSGDRTSPVGTAIVPTGATSAQLHLRWSFHGKGTYHATAELRVLSPDVTAATTAFTYSCR